MIETTGWIGSALLALCGFPLAYRAWKDGHSKGVDTAFLTIWLLGEICCLVYVVSLRDLPLILNYGINIMLISVVVKYKLKPRSSDE